MDKRGKCYVIREDDTGRIKIGHTTRTVESRLSELQTGNSSSLRVVACVPDYDGGVEAGLHTLLQAHRAPGGTEWFMPTAEVKAILAIAGCSTCADVVGREESTVLDALADWEFVCAVFYGLCSRSSRRDRKRGCYGFNPKSAACGVEAWLLHKTGVKSKVSAVDVDVRLGACDWCNVWLSNPDERISVRVDPSGESTATRWCWRNFGLGEPEEVECGKADWLIRPGKSLRGTRPSSQDFYSRLASVARLEGRE